MSTEPSSSLRVLRLCHVIQRVGLSRSTIYDRINPKSSRYDESFPKPIKIGIKSVGWIESSISEWIESKIKQSHSLA
ncbi:MULTISPECIES: AlpA family transcriptional regulator [unclassified Pseudomonas]|uniref:helix-turn-helix transcriptional regulator n=1 Tax=unclassified Pseudomonas TaxID=196821 RepID=UPI002B2227AE|nr:MULTISPECIES: AlpA family transcriptional regulator [unclassified Pseudomonas]MEA9978578.1 AlpA family transcriptional regulator [Pseudomonas sp. RTS4]MEB0196889.1 AlpA family transcriptional regulator [Pseudomonas sp. 5S4]MEB0245834.1 AlpA family transcriptional regulator [Pseudomonas sp. 10S5]